MLIFLRANIAAIIATLFDYAVTFLAVSFLATDPMVASLTGAVCGGAVNFLLGRFWAFNITQTSTQQQAYKYVFVWMGSLLLNACGMYLLTIYFEFHYAVAKLITAVIIAVGYNYPLQKNFVFRKI